MSLVAAIIVLVSGVIAGAILWTRLRHDAAGRGNRQRRLTGGLQGRVAEWLYWDAPLRKPRLARYTKDDNDAPTAPLDRALHALVLRTAYDEDMDAAHAHAQLVQTAATPMTRAFVTGRKARSVRLHWRSRYRGPAPLFFPWLYLVAYPRYGPRRMTLETLSATLKEFRNA